MKQQMVRVQSSFDAHERCGEHEHDTVWRAPREDNASGSASEHFVALDEELDRSDEPPGDSLCKFDLVIGIVGDDALLMIGLRRVIGLRWVIGYALLSIDG